MPAVHPLPVFECSPGTSASLSRHQSRPFSPYLVVSQAQVSELWISSPPERSPRIWRRRAIYPQRSSSSCSRDGRLHGPPPDRRCREPDRPLRAPCGQRSKGRVNQRSGYHMGTLPIAGFFQDDFLVDYFIFLFSSAWFSSGRLCLTELVLLFEVGAGSGRPMMGLEEWGGPIFRASLPTLVGRFCGHYELTPPIVPVRTSFCRSRTR